MELSELNEWADGLAALHSHFVPLFGRRKAREQAVKYLHGLMSQVERKSSRQFAEAAGDETPDVTQRLLYGTKRDADQAGWQTVAGMGVPRRRRRPVFGRGPTTPIAAPSHIC